MYGSVETTINSATVKPSAYDADLASATVVAMTMTVTVTEVEAVSLTTGRYLNSVARPRVSDPLHAAP